MRATIAPLSRNPAIRVFDRYLALLRDPEFGPAIGWSFVARLPIGITGLAIVLFVQARTGSYAEAGATAAAYLAGLALFAPVLGRWIDRFGPIRVLLACALLFPLALVALIAALAAADAALLAKVVAGFAGAAVPPVTTCMRTSFRQRLERDPLLVTAMSADSVLIEVVFIAGPALVACLVALFAPWVAILASAMTGAAGTWMFARSRLMRGWRASGSRPRSLLGPLSNARFLGLLGAGFAFAVVFGLIEIAVTGYATDKGHPALAGIVLAIMSVGSAAGGLLFGARQWHRPLREQYVIALGCMGTGIVPLAFVEAPLAFGVAAVISGFAMAPPLIIQSMLITRTVATEQTAEAYTWGMTALLCGVGAGLAAGGWALESFGVPLVFGVASMVALACAVSIRRLVPPEQSKNLGVQA